MAGELMPEQRQAMIPISVTYICDECGEGELELTQSWQSGQKFTNKHQCSNCGAIRVFKNKHYPRIVYEPAEPILFGKG